ncbi:hypothetical protein KAR91_31270 [Candidatus Pacearchaeota archaeon]|nr:hypothetical protein [Candidatus Pacearchaeota archaeon]
MPRPAEGGTVFRPDLAAYVLDQFESPITQKIGLKIMPIYAVPKKTASYKVIPAEQLLKVTDVKRAPRSAYQRDDWTWEEGFYNCKGNGKEEPIDDEERAELDQQNPGLADEVATLRAFNDITLNQEIRIAAKVQDAVAFTPHAVTNEWDDAANATPIDDVKDGVSAFRIQCGYGPDGLQINYTQYKNLTRCAQIINQLKYTFPGIDISKISAGQLAQLFDVPEVWIAGALYDAADKGQDRNITDIWSNEYASLLKLSKGRDIREVGFGRSFLWTASSPADPIVETYREEQISSDIIRVRHSVDERLIQSIDSSGNVMSNIAANCHYLMSNITT